MGDRHGSVRVGHRINSICESHMHLTLKESIWGAVRTGCWEVGQSCHAGPSTFITLTLWAYDGAPAFLTNVILSEWSYGPSSWVEELVQETPTSDGSKWYCRKQKEGLQLIHKILRRPESNGPQIRMSYEVGSGWGFSRGLHQFYFRTFENHTVK